MAGIKILRKEICFVYDKKFSLSAIRGIINYKTEKFDMAARDWDIMMMTKLGSLSKDDEN